MADSMTNLKELFVFVTNRRLTTFQLIERFEFESVSPAGSTRATKESRVEAFFSDLICELEGMLSIVLSLTGRKVAYIKTELVTPNSSANKIFVCPTVIQ